MRFSEITGQEQTKKKLIQTYLEGRVSHAQLFYGPEGNGKLALAIAYSQLLNCQDPIRGEGEVVDSCGVCPSCRQHQKLIHPDLHFVYPIATTRKVSKRPQSKDFLEDWRSLLIENNGHITLQEWYDKIGMENKQGIINADDCNDIIKTLGYKSYESEYKVMIIWMAEKLYYAAAPKLLKILEEPPDKTLFILVSEDPDSVIATIRSRTLLVRIPKFHEKDIARYLVDNTGIDEDHAHRMARISAGNLKLAIQRVKSEEEDRLYFESFRDWMRQCVQPRIPELVAYCSELSKNNREYHKAFFQYALKIVQACASSNFAMLPVLAREEEEHLFITRFSKFITQETLPEFMEQFNQAIYHIERNAYPQILYLDLSFKIIRLFKSVRNTA